MKHVYNKDDIRTIQTLHLVPAGLGRKKGFYLAIRSMYLGLLSKENTILKLARSSLPEKQKDINAGRQYC